MANQRSTRRATLTVWSMPFGVLTLVMMLFQPAVRPPWQAQFPPIGTGQITVGDTPLTVEIADETPEQTRGLGYREGLEPGTGMIFTYDEPRTMSFWMKGMRFCLDIIWIEDGTIRGAAENACPDPAGTADEDRARFRSAGAVQYVLEVPGGFLKDHGYGVGTVVSGIPELDVVSP